MLRTSKRQERFFAEYALIHSPDDLNNDSRGIINARLRKRSHRAVYTFLVSAAGFSRFLATPNLASSLQLNDRLLCVAFCRLAAKPAIKHCTFHAFLLSRESKKKKKKRSITARRKSIIHVFFDARGRARVRLAKWSYERPRDKIFIEEEDWVVTGARDSIVRMRSIFHANAIISWAKRTLQTSNLYQWHTRCESEVLSRWESAARTRDISLPLSPAECSSRGNSRAICILLSVFHE